jgi:hypothetical protein
MRRTITSFRKLGNTESRAKMTHLLQDYDHAYGHENTQRKEEKMT